MVGIKKALEGKGDVSGLLTVPQGAKVDGEDPAYSRAFEMAGSGHDSVKGGENSVVMDTLTSRQTAAAGIYRCLLPFTRDYFHVVRLFSTWLEAI